jgi:hypothetical protein
MCFFNVVLWFAFCCCVYMHATFVHERFEQGQIIPLSNHNKILDKYTWNVTEKLARSVYVNSDQKCNVNLIGKININACNAH